MIQERACRGVIAMLSMLALLLVASATAEARQFRKPIPIATPQRTAALLPPGAKPVSRVSPLSREQVEPMVRDLIQSWNTAGLAGKLAREFQDGQRLLDAVSAQAPRDASLRLLSIQGVQTMTQYTEPDPVTGGEKRVSIVSVTANTQLEFNNPATGFVRRPGLNEYILRISHPDIP